MEYTSPLLASAVFAGVILLIMAEWVHLTIAAFLGALLLIFVHILSVDEAAAYVGKSYETLALFFGVMVLVRAFQPTQIFEYLAAQMLVQAKGQGKRLLLGIVFITAPICAFLPNATTVMLLAPLIPPLATELGVNYVPLLILMVFVANSAGLLTLVGDPATYIVGDAINISFVDYLYNLSFGGVLALLTIILMLPYLFAPIWQLKMPVVELKSLPQINHPKVLALGGVIIAMVLTLFVVGEFLPVPIKPATAGLMGAGLALLLAHQSKIDTINHILRDLDWSTLLFFMSTFVLIGGLDKTGVIARLSVGLAVILQQNLLWGVLLLIFFVGICSSLVPNIPLVVAMVPLLKQYLVNVGWVGSDVLSADFHGQLPPEVLPLFYAMMFGATLGGNGSLMGASSNIVAAGVAEHHGQSIPFGLFLRYGIPMMTMQLLVAAIYVVGRFLM